MKTTKEQNEALQREVELLRETVKKFDQDCTYCKHSETPAPCADNDDEFLECPKCRYKCPCKDCRGNSNYELNIQKIEREAQE